MTGDPFVLELRASFGLQGSDRDPVEVRCRWDLLDPFPPEVWDRFVVSITHATDDEEVEGESDFDRTVRVRASRTAAFRALFDGSVRSIECRSGPDAEWSAIAPDRISAITRARLGESLFLRWSDSGKGRGRESEETSTSSGEDAPGRTSAQPSGRPQHAEGALPRA